MSAMWMFLALAVLSMTALGGVFVMANMRSEREHLQAWQLLIAIKTTDSLHRLLSELSPWTHVTREAKVVKMIVAELQRRHAKGEP